MKIDLNQNEIDVLQYLLIGHTAGGPGSRMDDINSVIHKLQRAGARPLRAARDLLPACRYGHTIIFKKYEKSS